MKCIFILALLSLSPVSWSCRNIDAKVEVEILKPGDGCDLIEIKAPSKLGELNLISAEQTIMIGNSKYIVSYPSLESVEHDAVQAIYLCVAESLLENVEVRFSYSRSVSNSKISTCVQELVVSDLRVILDKKYSRKKH